MAQYIIDDTILQDTANAIREKLGTTQPIKVSNYADSIRRIPTGEGGGNTGTSEEHGAIFIDYDGSTVEMWGASTISARTALPENPKHTGLVGQGWNWSLESIKSYAEKYPEADIFVGQMYKTESGLTEMDITLTKVTGLTVTCNMVGNKNWGDGTANSETSHTYADVGDYTITCDGTVIPGTMFDALPEICTFIRIGEKITTIGQYVFMNYSYLKTITIPNNVTTLIYPFHNCGSLMSITIPEGISTLAWQIFNNCGFKSISIPYGLKTLGDGALINSYNLRNVTIPDSVTSIQNRVFGGCENLESITIPDSVTSVENETFCNCPELKKVNFSKNIMTIKTDAFRWDAKITEYDFSRATAVPILEDISAFSNLCKICKIKVPASLYDQWITATNWSTYADYIVAV